ncbi:hypothetical protein PLICRDRAFT_133299, partial [Plicaturopsis crispa FD-325 SS-3]
MFRILVPHKSMPSIFASMSFITFYDWVATAPSPPTRKKVAQPPNVSPNMWVLYCQDKLRALRATGDRRPSNILFPEIGALWRAESDGIRAHYQGLAAQKKEEHKLMYPDWRCSPEHRPKKVGRKPAKQKATP